MKAEKNFGERISQNCRKSKKNIDLQLDDLIRDFSESYELNSRRIL